MWGSDRNPVLRIGGINNSGHTYDAAAGDVRSDPSRDRRRSKRSPGLAQREGTTRTKGRHRMIAFHRTIHEAVEDIMTSGFRDATGTYLTDREWTGVWFADQVLDANDGAIGDAVLALEMPEDLFAEYEWVEEGKRYREALIPADLANRQGRPRLIDLRA
jgi:hypothetical protein